MPTWQEAALARFLERNKGEPLSIDEEQIVDRLRSYKVYPGDWKTDGFLTWFCGTTLGKKEDFKQVKKEIKRALAKIDQWR